VKQRWFKRALFFGLLYLAVGVGFPFLARSTSSDHVRMLVRLTAWSLSIAVFVAHHWYELVRVQNSILATALHATVGVASGSFALALWVVIRANASAVSTGYSVKLALLIWPTVTAAPAFIAGLIIAAAISRLRRRRIAQSAQTSSDRDSQ
jgi:hypothetical protein